MNRSFGKTVNGKEADCKGILGIENRTENWKTARMFAPFIDDSEASKAARKALVNRLLSPYNPSLNLKDGEEIELELFWYGMRDYIKPLPKRKRPTAQDLARYYSEIFPKLRDDIVRFNGQQNEAKDKFDNLECHNYIASDQVKVKENSGRIVRSTTEELKSNLSNTEIDIVLATPSCLFIGEAKHKSDFDAKSKYVLVHQLVREYVLARILVCLTEKPKRVIPFVVGTDTDYLKRTAQVRFMVDQGKRDPKQGWLKKDNVLAWDKIAALAKRDLEAHQNAIGIAPV